MIKIVTTKNVLGRINRRLASEDRRIETIETGPRGAEDGGGFVDLCLVTG